MMVLLTGPLSLLCFYLSLLCFRRELPKQALALGGFALFFLLLSVAILGAGYYAWESLEGKPITVL